MEAVRFSAFSLLMRDLILFSLIFCKPSPWLTLAPQFFAGSDGRLDESMDSPQTGIECWRRAIGPEELPDPTSIHNDPCIQEEVGYESEVVQAEAAC